MKVRYRKGAAIHSGPELCGAGREAVVEAFTGEWFPLSSKCSAHSLAYHRRVPSRLQAARRAQPQACPGAPNLYDFPPLSR